MSEGADPDPDAVLSLPEAAELAGVHYMTAYRWVRTSRLKAEKAGGAWRVRLGDLRALTDGGSPSNSPSAAGGRRPGTCHGDRIGPLTDALLRGDQGGAWLLIEESRRAGVDPLDVLCELVEPAMAEIGRRWARGEVGIAGEHRATAVVTRLIGRLGPASTRAGRNRGGVVVGAVEHNQHALGAAVVGDVFRLAGFDVCDLGADVPAAEFAAMGGRPGVAAVCISVAVAGSEDAVEATVAAVRAEADVPVLVGGTGAPSARWATDRGADGWCADGREAPTLLERLAARSAERRIPAALG